MTAAEGKKSRRNRSAAVRLDILLSMQVARSAMMLLCFAAVAAADPTTQPTSQPADRSTPIGTCQLFDQTVADSGVDGALKFYHCTSNAQRRYARAECEYYVALNRLVRSVKARQNEDAAGAARSVLGDSDDYANVTVDAEGDSALLKRADAKPLQMIRIANEWCFSMPGWFADERDEDLKSTRLYYESAADQIDAVREQVDAGKFKTQPELEEQLQKIAATR